MQILDAATVQIESLAAGESPAILRALADRLEALARTLRRQATEAETAAEPPAPAASPDSDPIAIWTDGACSGNPGPGGWAVVFADAQGSRELVGGSDLTTNNAMELEGILAALRAVPHGARLAIHTDSQNAIGWLSLGWKRKDPKIADLCAEIDATAAARGLHVAYAKAIAHQNDAMNNQADALAAAEAQRRRALVQGKG